MEEILHQLKTVVYPIIHRLSTCFNHPNLVMQDFATAHPQYITAVFRWPRSPAQRSHLLFQVLGRLGQKSQTRAGHRVLSIPGGATRGIFLVESPWEGRTKKNLHLTNISAAYPRSIVRKMWRWICVDIWISLNCGYVLILYES